MANPEKIMGNPDETNRAEQARLRFEKGWEEVRKSMESSIAVQSFVRLNEFLSKHGLDDSEIQSDKVKDALVMLKEHPDVKLHEILSKLTI